MSRVGAPPHPLQRPAGVCADSCASAYVTPSNLSPTELTCLVAEVTTQQDGGSSLPDAGPCAYGVQVKERPRLHPVRLGRSPNNIFSSEERGCR